MQDYPELPISAKIPLKFGSGDIYFLIPFLAILKGTSRNKLIIVLFPEEVFPKKITYSEPGFGL